MIKANFFEIKRFAVHDGDGIRTTLFLKGCPLRCLWCHNPEGLSGKVELAYLPHKCIGCGECEKACESGAHILSDGSHVFLRENCIGCGRCEEACLGGALTLYGKKMTVDELLPLLLEDREFYENSGGGVTISGGECLLQADFCGELLKRLKEAGINTATDTCGFISKEALDKVIPYTDTFLYDFKAYDEDVHIRCTGHSNELILDNLKYLDSQGKKIEIRIPYVPDYNSDQIEKIALFLRELKNITRVRVLPYHNYVGSKYESLGLAADMPKRLPTEKELDEARNIIKFNTGLEVW